MKNRSNGPGWRRVVGRIVVVLVIGVIVNLGAGYGMIIIRGSPSEWTWIAPDLLNRNWPKFEQIARSRAPQSVRAYRSWGMQMIVYQGTIAGEAEEGIVLRTSGWPMQSLVLADRYYYDQNGVGVCQPISGLIGGQSFPIGWPANPLVANDNAHRLPLVPLPFGFVVNSLFYAAAVTVTYLMLFVPRSICRLMRARQCRCTQCGYSSSGLSKCPECGAPVVFHFSVEGQSHSSRCRRIFAGMRHSKASPRSPG